MSSDNFFYFILEQLIDFFHFIVIIIDYLISDIFQAMSCS